MTAGLFLVFLTNFHFLADRLAIWYTRFGEGNLHFVLGRQFADNNIQMLITHTVHQELTVFLVIKSLQCTVFFHHLLQCLGNLINIGFVLGCITFVCIRGTEFKLIKNKRIALQ